MRTEVLKLYRDMMRAASHIEDGYHREEMKSLIRDGFRKNQHLDGEVHVCVQFIMPVVLYQRLLNNY